MSNWDHVPVKVFGWSAFLSGFAVVMLLLWLYPHKPPDLVLLPFVLYMNLGFAAILLGMCLEPMKPPNHTEPWEL